MRFRLSAEVLGSVFIKNQFKYKNGDYLYEFFSDTSKKLKKISVSKHVPKDLEDSFGSDIQPGDGNIKYKISFKSDKKYYDELIEKLQEVESHLGFSTIGGLQKIFWENPSIEFVAEDESIDEVVKQSSIQPNRRYLEKACRLSEEYLINVIKKIEEQEFLFISKSFWLMGSNLYRKFQYILASYQFYFIIEDFYANGKSGKNQVLQEFKKSQEFDQVINHSIDFLKVKSNDFYLRLIKELDKEEIELSSEGIQNYLFDMRGRLHHYHSKSPFNKPTPINQEACKDFSFLIMFISSQAILAKSGEGLN